MFSTAAVPAAAAPCATAEDCVNATASALGSPAPAPLGTSCSADLAQLLLHADRSTQPPPKSSLRVRKPSTKAQALQSIHTACTSRSPRGALPSADPPVSASKQQQQQQQQQDRSQPESRLLASTTLAGGTKVISQDVFMRTILRPGANQRPVSDLFSFYRPRKRPRSTMSAVLAKLSEEQHDIMYALAGCSDVASTMSRVEKPVRQALFTAYNIDKVDFNTWFKNRRQVAPKGAGKGAGAAGDEERQEQEQEQEQGPMKEEEGVEEMGQAGQGGRRRSQSPVPAIGSGGNSEGGHSNESPDRGLQAAGEGPGQQAGAEAAGGPGETGQMGRVAVAAVAPAAPDATVGGGASYRQLMAGRRQLLAVRPAVAEHGEVYRPGGSVSAPLVRFSQHAIAVMASAAASSAAAASGLHGFEGPDPLPAGRWQLRAHSGAGLPPPAPPRGSMSPEAPDLLLAHGASGMRRCRSTSLGTCPEEPSGAAAAAPLPSPRGYAAAAAAAAAAGGGCWEQLQRRRRPRQDSEPPLGPGPDAMEDDTSLSDEQLALGLLEPKPYGGGGGGGGGGAVRGRPGADGRLLSSLSSPTLTYCGAQYEAGQQYEEPGKAREAMGMRHAAALWRSGGGELQPAAPALGGNMAIGYPVHSKGAAAAAWALYTQAAAAAYHADYKAGPAGSGGGQGGGGGWSSVWALPAAAAGGGRTVRYRQSSVPPHFHPYYSRKQYSQLLASSPHPNGGGYEQYGGGGGGQLVPSYKALPGTGGSQRLMAPGPHAQHQQCLDQDGGDDGGQQPGSAAAAGEDAPAPAPYAAMRLASPCTTPPPLPPPHAQVQIQAAAARRSATGGTGARSPLCDMPALDFLDELYLMDQEDDVRYEEDSAVQMMQSGGSAQGQDQAQLLPVHN